MRESKRAVTDDPVMLRIIEALKESGKTAKELTVYLGIHKGAFDNWKFQGSKTYYPHISQIADFTGTSLDWLIRGEEMDTNRFTEVERKFLLKYRNLSKGNQVILEEVVSRFERLDKLEKDFVQIDK